MLGRERFACAALLGPELRGVADAKDDNFVVDDFVNGDVKATGERLALGCLELPLCSSIEASLATAAETVTRTRRAAFGSSLRM
jgi:hypothetical protein